MTATFEFQYNKAYRVSSSWNTLVDDVVSGHEQRRNLWSSPKKKWVLEFNKNNVDTESLLNFFDQRRGKFEAFHWTWQQNHPVTGKEMGGDGQTYLVRFDTDELNLDHLTLGYTKFQITLVQVLS